MNTATLSKPGTLIHARGREWIILPESTEELLIVRPIGGLDEEATGILTAVEPVRSTTFSLPAADDVGDFASGRLLRDAARLSTRAAAGPFRSFGRIAVEPRPYQLVPLMMALKLDPVRLLIADDVGIGKTIEAGIIARELLDRGEIRRLTVLCPPHLAEQWQRELAEKFHIDAELVLSGTVQRLERGLRLGESIFDRHRYTVVSTDFIKSPQKVEDFIIKCPEFVIVDEVHGCTLATGAGSRRHQRFELLQRVAADRSRHLLLVTATPHSGNEDAFRSLLSLLDEEFSDLPTDLDRAERAGVRQTLARHMVQRRRADVRHWLETDTAFPERKDKETTYTFSEKYRKLFDDILAFAHEYVSADQQGQQRRRVRYWSALALLRCVSSSPAAAAATLRSRAAVDVVDNEDVDEVGRRTVLDHGNDDDPVILDLNPGSNLGDASESARSKLLKFARRAERLPARADHKLQGAISQIEALVNDGFQPVVFCRFVDTAEYVARELRKGLPTVSVESVTGLLPPAEREARIESLVTGHEQYVLVCTDCLSEGINLQQNFTAVLHYDLAWNPTRHEQREGRVDRFGQKASEVRVVTYYGTDNPIDGVILDVLIRKHKSIKSALGVTVAVPESSETVAEVLFEAALFREYAGRAQLALDFIDDLDGKKQAIHDKWDNARDREKASRSRFAQRTLAPEAVASELHEVRKAIGRNEDVARFFHDVLLTATVQVTTEQKSVTVHLRNETPRSLRQAIGHDEPFSGRFDLPLGENELYLGRTSPIVEGLAGWTLDQALDPAPGESRRVGSRSGVIKTSEVTVRTTLLVVRFRYQLDTTGSSTPPILCEEIVPLACTGATEPPGWLAIEEAEKLLSACPQSNLTQTAIEQQVDLLVRNLERLRPALAKIAIERSALQRDAHKRVRESARIRGRISIEPVLPVDILGAYVLLPRLS